MLAFNTGKDQTTATPEANRNDDNKTSEKNPYVHYTLWRWWRKWWHDDDDNTRMMKVMMSTVMKTIRKLWPMHPTNTSKAWIPKDYSTVLHAHQSDRYGIASPCIANRSSVYIIGNFRSESGQTRKPTLIPRQSFGLLVHSSVLTLHLWEILIPTHLQLSWSVPIFMSVCQWVCLSVCLPACICVCMSCLSCNR